MSHTKKTTLRRVGLTVIRRARQRTRPELRWLHRIVQATLVLLFSAIINHTDNLSVHDFDGYAIIVAMPRLLC